MFELALPWLLILIILPPLIWYLIARAAEQAPTSLRIPFYRSLVTIINQEKRTTVSAPSLWLLAIIWVLLLLAASGPRWVGEPMPINRAGRNIMLALDLSGSMALQDMLLQGRPVSRLTVVKLAAEQFVRARAGDRVGLILFGSQAYLQTPLTYDRQSVLMRLEDATVGLAGKTTAIGDALGLAVKRLQDIPPASRVIILLTDGVNNSGVLTPIKAAELAKADNIKVYTIGLGAEPQPLNGGFFTIDTAADLDEKTLQEVAKMTGGQYFRATDTHSLQLIYNTINNLETTTNEQTSIRPEKEYYPWPLGLALLFFIYWFSRKADLSIRKLVIIRREKSQ